MPQWGTGRPLGPGSRLVRGQAGARRGGGVGGRGRPLGGRPRSRTVAVLVARAGLAGSSGRSAGSSRCLALLARRGYRSSQSVEEALHPKCPAKETWGCGASSRPGRRLAARNGSGGELHLRVLCGRGRGRSRDGRSRDRRESVRGRENVRDVVAVGQALSLRLVANGFGKRRRWPGDESAPVALVRSAATCWSSSHAQRMPEMILNRGTSPGHVA